MTRQTIQLRTLLNLVYAMNSLTANPRAQQLAAKGDLSINLCERYVFRGVFQCSPMQYYVRHMPVSNPVYVSSSIISGFSFEFGVAIDQLYSYSSECVAV